MQWERVSVVDAFNEFERFHHTGLTADGRHCLIASDNEDFAVVDVETGSWLWTDLNDSESGLPDISSAASDGWYDLRQGAVSGRYHVFGIYVDFPIQRAERLGIYLDIDSAQARLHLRDITAGAIIETLVYEQDSGDWAYASFSLDFSTIAVLEPYYVTLFRAPATSR